jgi:hypothetical protein
VDAALVQHFAGVGGLESRNAIQLLHAMFSQHKELKTRRKKIVRAAVWKEVRGTWHRRNARELGRCSQRCHATYATRTARYSRWWTIGLLAQFATKYLDFFPLMAKGCCNMTKTDQKEIIIASNLLSLASSDWIVADIYLIAGVAKSWLNPHMR